MLRRLSGRDVCGILAAHGFARVRQTGSLAIMQSKHGSGTISVPVPMHDEIPTGTLASIIRQSGLDRGLFEA